MKTNADLTVNATHKAISPRGSRTGAYPASAPDRCRRDTEKVSELQFMCFTFDLHEGFGLCFYQEVLKTISEKAMKQRQPTVVIRTITVNNQTQWDGTDCYCRRVTAYLLTSSLCCTPDFISECVFHRALDEHQAECSICSTAPRAAWLWHLHRQPWVLQRGGLLSVGCSQPSGDSLHLETLPRSLGIHRLAYTGSRIKYGWKGEGGCCFQGWG